VAYERLVRKLTRENLWMYILTLLRQGPLYGYEIREKIEEQFGFKPGQVTSYIVLYKLERSGLVEVQRESKGERGPPRRYYSLTEKGEQTLQKAKEFLASLEQSIS